MMRLFRMIAIALAIALWAADARRWARWLGAAAGGPAARPGGLRGVRRVVGG